MPNKCYVGDKGANSYRTVTMCWLSGDTGMIILSLRIRKQVYRFQVCLKSCKCSRPPSSVGDALQDPQWRPATTDSAEPIETMIFSIHTDI